MLRRPDEDYGDLSVCCEYEVAAWPYCSLLLVAASTGDLLEHSLKQGWRVTIALWCPGSAWYTLAPGRHSRVYDSGILWDLMPGAVLPGLIRCLILCTSAQGSTAGGAL